MKRRSFFGVAVAAIVGLFWKGKPKHKLLDGLKAHWKCDEERKELEANRSRYSNLTWGEPPSFWS